MNKKDYPPQTEKYAISVKKGRNFRKFDIGCIPISVGFLNDKEKFDALFSWAKDQFKEIFVLVDDSLQKPNHVYKIATETNGLSSEEIDKKAFEDSRNGGLEWIQENISTLKKYFSDGENSNSFDEDGNEIEFDKINWDKNNFVKIGNFRIIRWCYFTTGKNKEKYENYLREVEDLELKSSVFSEKKERDVFRFKKNISDSKNEKIFLEQCNIFVNTEIAGFRVFYDFLEENKIKLKIVYTGDELRSLKHIESEDRHWTSVRIVDKEEI